MSHLPLPDVPESGAQVNSTALLTVLDDAVISGRYPAEALWQTIADTARILTGADGTAIALQADGIVVCRARCGAIAPPLGSPLNVDSGISGECLRTATSLRCDDTLADDRVDPDVCLLLGIRSIAVVPLCNAMGSFGLLEVLSGRAHAFTDEQIGSLKNIGEIAESAYEQEFGAEISSFKRPSVSFERYDSLAASPRIEVPLPTGISNKPLPRIKRRYWITSGVAALLVLAVAIIWWTWHEPLGESAASHPTTPASTAGMESSNANAPGGIHKPSSGIPRESLIPNFKDQPGKSRMMGTITNAANRENVQERPATRSPTTTSDAIVAPQSPAESTPSSSAAVSSDEPPPIVGTGTAVDSAKLTNIVSAPTAMPKVEIRVSKGVTPASLTRRVAPVYPPMALSSRLEGSVTLMASVAADGTIGEIKVLRGEPIFATAAVEAVHQWRYTPTKLDGNPIPVTREITINFKLP